MWFLVCSKWGNLLKIRIYSLGSQFIPIIIDPIEKETNKKTVELLPLKVKKLSLTLLHSKQPKLHEFWLF